MPPAAPAGWHWPQAYTGRLRGDVKAVGSSLVCLPEVDAGGAGAGACRRCMSTAASWRARHVCPPPTWRPAGGPGPRLESWAFAVDGPGLELLVRAGVFHVHTEKLGSEGIVVRGEEQAVAAAVQPPAARCPCPCLGMIAVVPPALPTCRGVRHHHHSAGGRL